jgi:nucleoside-diphosphate-sugar epimerase
MSKKNKVLVLGSSGQVGAYLVKYLNKKGYQVMEFDIVRSNLEDLRTPLNINLRKLLDDADFVFFLAFDVGGSRYLSKYQHTYQFVDNNVRLMSNTFELLKFYNKPFVFASSQMSNMTYSPYGVLKAIGEIYTKTLGGRIVKFWNVYGVEHDMEKSHVITDFIFKAKNNKIIDMMTDGQEEREFLYADDCCTALEAVMNNYDEFTSESELNITSFESTKIIDIANIIADYFNATVQPSDKVDTVQMNKKNVADTLILDYWKPVTSIKEGINNIIKEINV